MNIITDKDATILAKEETYNIDYNAREIFDRGANYLDELAGKNFFSDAVINFIKNSSVEFTGEIENTEDILLFIKKAYENSGIKGDKKKDAFSYNPSSLREWVCGKRLPSKAEAQRIALCLGMDVLQATEFIFKGSLVKPFNFKEITDSVYYFCLNTGRTFAEAQEIIQQVETSKLPMEEHPENDTIKIGEKVQSTKSKEELIKYLVTNKKGFEKQNLTALNTLKALIKKSVDYAEQERKEIFHDTYSSPINSEKDVPAILSVILGYEARIKINGVETYKKKISDSNFPYLVKNNFPQPQQLHDILEGKKTSSEAIRKAIILFAFYNMFSELRNSDGEYDNGFDAYSDTIDEILYRCGYVQMYWKHPYDWMFGYCAAALDPIDEMRQLIEAFYLDLEDMYSEESRFSKDQ